MKTYTVQAWQVEVGDWLVLGSDHAWEVVETDDQGDGVMLSVTDDGEVETFAFTAFEDLTLVASFDDDTIETLLEES